MQRGKRRKVHPSTTDRLRREWELFHESEGVHFLIDECLKDFSVLGTGDNVDEGQYRCFTGFLLSKLIRGDPRQAAAGAVPHSARHR